MNASIVPRARDLLRFDLDDVAGSMYGSNKDAVANAMADNEDHCEDGRVAARELDD
ncbi:MAG: hypothetical protein AAGF11_52510 [Myxococcota bacterium]